MSLNQLKLKSNDINEETLLMNNQVNMETDMLKTNQSKTNDNQNRLVLLLIDHICLSCT
jgi:hypothetical protein